MKAIATMIFSAFVAAAQAQDSPALQAALAQYPKDTCWCVFGTPDTSGAATVSSGTLISLGGGQVANNMPGWIDPETAGSRFFHIPESQILNAAYIPPWNIAAGSFMRFWCADHPSIKMCDIYINIYKCAGCEAGLNADFRDYLVTEGWTPSQCGPKFISDAGEDKHKFMSFRKQVPRNHLERVDMDSNVRLMFASLASDGVDCSALALDKCETSGYDQCRIIYGQCVDDWCPRMLQGPCVPPLCGRGGCTNCALSEAAFQ